MLFNTPIFMLFFSVFFILYSFVFLRRTPRILLIIVGSLIFYAGWNFRFIPLLIFSAVVDYFLAIAISNCHDKARKRWLLSISIATNLGILATFKYADFALSSVADFLTLLNFEVSLPTLALTLPIGISFYTFQSMSYTIDVYREDMKPHKGILPFIAALSFFPQLVAGPILRARHILPQFDKIPVPTWEQAKSGFLLITIGLFKKTIADLLAAPVLVAFNSDGPVSMIETWIGVLAFAGQIYGDFSGYTDMAIGMALLLGFQIPINFRLPYFASSPVDFWRRWHISLSTWLRDYVYISLGGNKYARYRNIFITMLLGGLWHGAAWTFVFWGFLHAILIVGTHILSKTNVFAVFNNEPTWPIKLLKIILTFYLILISWVFFRATDLNSAFEMLTAMHTLKALPLAPPNMMLISLLTITGVSCMHIFDFIVIRYGEGIKNRAWVFWPLLIIFQFVCFIVGEPNNAFIYFQF